MDPKFQIEVDPNEDTEWNDILRSKGIIPEKEPDETEQLEEALAEAVKKQEENRLENKDLEELDELEDEEDEDFLNFYKQKRISEMNQLSQKSRFGMVYSIAKPEYQKEVTDASIDCFVFLHMSLASSLQSRLLASHFETLSKRFPEIKFCDIPANRAVENYPESNCPTLIVYHNKDVVKQYITLAQLGGNSTRLTDIENVIVSVEAVKHSDKRLMQNQEDADLEQHRMLRFARKSLREDADDDDFFD